MSKFILLVVWLIYAFPLVGQDLSLELIKHITNESDLVVVGKIESIESRYGQDGKSIMSYINVRTSVVLKGDQAIANVSVEIGGGKIGNKVHYLTHQPQFNVNDEVLFFLIRTQTAPYNYYRIITPGGKLNIWSDGSNQAKMVYQDLYRQRPSAQERASRSLNVNDIIFEIRKNAK